MVQVVVRYRRSGSVWGSVRKETERTFVAGRCCLLLLALLWLELHICQNSHTVANIMACNAHKDDTKSSQDINKPKQPVTMVLLTQQWPYFEAPVTGWCKKSYAMWQRLLWVPMKVAEWARRWSACSQSRHRYSHDIAQTCLHNHGLNW